MPKLKLFLFSAVAVSIFAANVEEAHACSCIKPLPPAQAFAEADAVFMGKVVSFELTGDAFSLRLAKFAVSKIWKGERSAVSEILTANYSAVCGYHFQVGESYVVYAYKSAGGKLNTSLCTRTKPEHLAADDLNYLESASIFPLGLDNAWTLVMKQAQIRYTDTIKDSSRIAGKLYYNFDHYFETAGEHTVAWDGANFAGEKAPGGIYFYRLQMGKHVEVRKLILMR